MLLAAAIDKARSTEPRKIAAALHALNGWQGVTGSHSFDANGDVQGRHEDNKDGKTIDGKDVVFKIVKGDHYEIFSDRTPWEYTKR
jgi:ABC-type branched-subunit amino acid transport system substrate-binding protein